MQHHILVKWRDAAHPPELSPIRELFAQSLTLAGVQAFSLHPNILHLPKRFDLMIVITMEQDALAGFDASPVHRQWKELYGGLIAEKVILDCE